MTERPCTTCKWHAPQAMASDCIAPQNIDHSWMAYRARSQGAAGLAPDDRVSFRYMVTNLRGSGWIETRVHNHCGREGRWWAPAEGQA
jgi:hypothetical protein